MILIDRFSQKPVFEQLVDSIEQQIVLGVYPPGTLLPSLRELSVTLGINPNTVQKSYGELTRRGVILPSVGSGCYVSPDAPERIRAGAESRLPALVRLCEDMKLRGVPEETLLAAVRSVYTTGADAGAQTDTQRKEDSDHA